MWSSYNAHLAILQTPEQVKIQEKARSDARKLLFGSSVVSQQVIEQSNDFIILPISVIKSNSSY